MRYFFKILTLSFAFYGTCHAGFSLKAMKAKQVAAKANQKPLSKAEQDQRAKDQAESANEQKEAAAYAAREKPLEIKWAQDRKKEIDAAKKPIGDASDERVERMEEFFDRRIRAAQADFLKRHPSSKNQEAEDEEEEETGFSGLRKELARAKKKKEEFINSKGQVNVKSIEGKLKKASDKRNPLCLRELEKDKAHTQRIYDILTAGIGIPPVVIPKMDHGKNIAASLSFF